MYGNNDRQPAWYRDAKWLTGVLLALLVAAGILLVSLAQLTRPALGMSVSASLLNLTLLNELTANQEEAAQPAVTIVQGFDYTPGDDLSLLPGINFSAGATEIETLRAEDARLRLAKLLAEDIISGGLEAALDRVGDTVIASQLQQLAQTTLPSLFKGMLESSLFPPPAELGLGTRLADWPLQAQQRPGSNVQPIVGIFVTALPEFLEPLSPREIGEYVVNELGLSLLNNGLLATQELISRETVRTLFTETTNTDLRDELEGVINVALIPQDSLIEERLAEARAVIEALNTPVEDAEPEALQGITLASELEGLTPEQANQKIILDLASAVYERGIEDTLPLMTDAAQVNKVKDISPLLNLFTRMSHQSLVRYSYITGIVAVLLLAFFLFFGSGWFRIFGLGLVLCVSAALGAIIFTLLTQYLPTNIALPTPPPDNGIPTYTADLITYIVQRMPAEASQLFARNHLVVLATGIGTIIIFFLLQIFQAFGGRNRSSF